nr:hypothetical protein [Vibrio scophthalmi]
MKTEDREDWILEQVDRGIEVLITNPELVKTGLDLLEFPSIVFTNTGYNVYTLMQAARRSWRIGQKNDVDVNFLGYQGSAQMTCCSLILNIFMDLKQDNHQLTPNPCTNSTTNHHA